MSDTWDLPEGQTQVDMAAEWKARYEQAMRTLEAVSIARQAWAIKAAEESARADALLEAASGLIRFYAGGGDIRAGSSGLERRLKKLEAAVEAAKVKHGE